MKDDAISRQAAIDVIFSEPLYESGMKKRDADAVVPAIYEKIKSLPPAQPDEKLKKCRFEYINACRIVTFPTPDTTKKDISDAYAVIKALQPIFGDVTF